MKTLFDTSVIVSGIVESHPMHSKCLPWLQRAKSGEFDCVVVSHTLAETYAVLTTLPVKPRISPLVARNLVYTNLEALAKFVPLTIADYRTTIDSVPCTREERISHRAQTKLLPSLPASCFPASFHPVQKFCRRLKSKRSVGHKVKL